MLPACKILFSSGVFPSTKTVTYPLEIISFFKYFISPNFSITSSAVIAETNPLVSIIAIELNSIYAPTIYKLDVKIDFLKNNVN